MAENKTKLFKFSKEVSITNVIGWFFTIVAFVWIMAVEVSAADNRIKQAEDRLEDHKVLIEKLTSKSENHSGSIIKLKSHDENQQQQLKAIKDDTNYLRKKVDKLLEKVK